MAKRNSKKKKTPVESLINAVFGNERFYNVMGASIKDGYCNYSYKITQGIGLGDTHDVKGKGIVKDELVTAISEFNVHLAIIAEVFKRSNIEFKGLDEVRNHELTALFTVTAFKLIGKPGDESIILQGFQYVHVAGGRLKIETPKIPLDTASSYPYWQELLAAADEVREQVALYKEGNYTVAENDEVNEDDPRQTKMTFFKTEENDNKDDESKGGDDSKGLDNDDAFKDGEV